MLSSEDEFADFETWDFGNLDGSQAKTPEMLPGEYARSGLLRGLQRQVARVRTATQTYLRTDVKDRVRALRDELPPDDRLSSGKVDEDVFRYEMLNRSAPCHGK